MKFFKNKLLHRVGLMLFIVGVLLIIFYHIIQDYNGFIRIIGMFKKLMAPFVYGLIIAYLLCPAYNLSVKKAYKLLSKLFKNKKRAFILSRAIATIISLIILIGAIAGFLSLIIPQVINSISKIAQEFPTKTETINDWIRNLTSHITKNPNVLSTIYELVDKLGANLSDWIDHKFMPGIGMYMSKISQGVLLTLRSFLNILIGIIVAIYFLNNKEKFQAQTRKIILALNNEKIANEIFNFARFTNKTFGGFINGKIIDSIIIGIICFFTMKIIGLPYTVLISTIIGITNIIPFFGPIIGAVPSAVIIALISPIHAIYFVIMILILQQIDGNIIGPAILGGTTGLSSFWVMFSILIGGGLFGVVGMILGLPVFAIIYYYLGRYINNRLKNKNLPYITMDYQNYDKYNINKNDIL